MRLKHYLSISILMHLLLLIKMQSHMHKIDTIEVVVKPAEYSEKRLKKNTLPTNSIKNDKSIYTSTIKALSYKLTNNYNSKDIPTHTDSTQNWKLPISYTNDNFSNFENLSMSEIKIKKEFWKFINDNIERNDFLSEYNKIGKIHIRLNIDDQANNFANATKACGKDTILKVIALRAIKKFYEKYHDLAIENKIKSLSFQFSWSNTENCKSLQGINGDYLSFCNYSELKRHTFTTGDKIYNYAAALQAGPDAYEVIKEYHRQEFRAKTEFNPFESYERDTLVNVPCE